MAKIDDLMKKKAQLNARIQKERQRQENKKRKADTTAKILLGAATLKGLKARAVGANEAFDWCFGQLNQKDQGRLKVALETAEIDNNKG